MWEYFRKKYYFKNSEPPFGRGRVRTQNMRNLKNINKKGFTLAEVVTAVGILVIIVGFTGVIFKSGIDAYRQSGANAEILQKFRMITTSLDRDFSQISKDGPLGIRYHSVTGRKISKTGNATDSVRMDGIYYITTGDFQTQNQNNPPTYERSNLARVFISPDTNSMFNTVQPVPLNKCKLARDVMLFTPLEGALPWPVADCCNISLFGLVHGSQDFYLLSNSVPAGMSSNFNEIRRLMCENIGEFRIEWTFGQRYADNTLVWDPVNPPNDSSIDRIPTWPKALKFTFTIYDSKEIIKGGQTFTHIVYLEN